MGEKAGLSGRRGWTLGWWRKTTDSSIAAALVHFGTRITPPQDPQSSLKKGEEGFAALSTCMAWLKTANVCFAQLTGVGVDVTIQSHRQVWRRVVQRRHRQPPKLNGIKRRLTQIHNCVLLSSHSCIPRYVKAAPAQGRWVLRTIKSRAWMDWMALACLAP